MDGLAARDEAMLRLRTPTQHGYLRKGPSWAFTTYGQSHVSLCRVLARSAERRMGELNVQSLANVA